MARKLNTAAYRKIGAPEHVLRWLEEGIKIPFIHTPNRCFYANRINTANKRRFMDEQVKKLLQNEVIRESETKPKCILAMQCVPKKGNKLRLVMDCRPINESIKTPTFSQEGITAVAEIIEDDDLMVTMDLKDGFHHIFIHPDHQQYLGFTWRGRFYVWQFLPFGISCAPYF